MYLEIEYHNIKEDPWSRRGDDSVLEFPIVCNLVEGNYLVGRVPRCIFCPSKRGVDYENDGTCTLWRIYIEPNRIGGDPLFFRNLKTSSNQKWKKFFKINNLLTHILTFLLSYLRTLKFKYYPLIRTPVYSLILLGKKSTVGFWQWEVLLNVSDEYFPMYRKTFHSLDLLWKEWNSPRMKHD